MKVFAILTPGFPKDESDSTCLPAFQQFALSLKKLNPHLRIVIISFQYPFFKKKYSWNGIEVISLGGKNETGFNRLLVWIRAYRALKMLRKHHELIGLLSLWLGECAFIGAKFSKRMKVKHLTWIIGQDAKADNRYVRRVKPKSEQLVAMSDFLKEEFYKNHNIVPSFVAENGINENSFPPLNTGERTIDILGAGSLIPLKNYDLFIDILFEIKKAIPNVKAVIIGSGEQHAELEKKARSLELQNNLTFTGLQPHSTVLEYMNNSKIFLHTSNYEGNSTVMMEALYSGCYTLSSQPLSNSETTNLIVLSKQTDFVRFAINRLMQRGQITERIVFNTMDDSAERIFNHFK